MPAKSKKQQIAMAIAEHDPDKLYKRNKGLKKMSKKELHDFASTKRKNLPETAPKAAKKKQRKEVKKDHKKEKAQEEALRMRRIAAIKILRDRRRKR